MRKLLVAILILGVAGVASAGDHFISKGANGRLPLSGDPMEYLMEDMRTRELIEWSKRLDLEAEQAKWAVAGCTVEGLDVMDEVRCPGFRVDPKVEEAFDYTFSAHDDYYGPVKVKERKSHSFLDGQI